MRFREVDARAVEPLARVQPARDRRIDFFRGLALLCIFIDHIPGNQLSRLTLHNFGFSDAAEMFVLLAGVSAMLAYCDRPDGLSRILRRVASIYTVQAGLILAAAALLALAWWVTGDPALLLHQCLEPFRSNLPLALARTLTLDLQPAYFDILPLYILLLAWLPTLLRLSRTSLVPMLAVATGLWLTAFCLGLNLPGHRNGGWYFNPFSWQLLFAIGVAIGLREVRGGHEQRLPRSPLLLAAAVAIVVAGFVAAAPWTQIPIPAVRAFRVVPAEWLGAISKTYASPWRIAHVLSLAYIAAVMIERDAPWLRSRWALWVAEFGRRPLVIFALASLTSVAATIALTVANHGLAFQLLVNVAGLSLLAALGRVHARSMLPRSSRQNRLATPAASTGSLP